MEIQVTVPAIPIAQPRQRHRNVAAKGRSFIQNYTPSKHPVQDFKATVRMAFQAVYSGPPLTGPLRCDLVFVFPRPQSMIWKKREMPREWHAKKPDRDNLEKSLCDALKGIAWIDDAQVCDGSLKKYIAAGDEQPHVVIRLSAAE